MSLAPVLRGEPCKEVDLGSEKLREASDRVVQIVTQVEGRASTAVPLGTGALIWKDVIVTARHNVVDSDGRYVDAFSDGQEAEFLIANPAADLALLKLPGGSMRGNHTKLNRIAVFIPNLSDNVGLVAFCRGQDSEALLCGHFFKAEGEEACGSARLPARG